MRTRELSFLRLLPLYIGVGHHVLMVVPAAVSLPPAVSPGTMYAWSWSAEGTDFRTKFDREIVPGQPVLVSTRVEHGPVIDGEVNKDPVWQNCARTHGAWTQIARHQASGRQTVVYSCYDDKNLYFAFVCEEPELASVRMDGKLDKDDCVEAILEVGGIEGNGEIYSFRANYRAQKTAWGTQEIDTRMYYMPEWKSAGKSGPNRWMVEMAIPFASLKRHSVEKGLSTPNRGDVLGLKLVRWGAQQEDPKNRMVSTWNADISYPFVYIAGMNGLLYFEDSNALRDGDFAMPAEKSPWIRSGTELSQSVEVRASSFYVLSVAADRSDGSAALLIDGKPVPLKDGRAGFWTGAKQDKILVALQTAAGATPGKVTMLYQPGEQPRYTYFKKGYAIELDLGQEYYVRGLDVLFLMPYMSGFTVWGKVNQEDDWGLLSMDDGMFVEPSTRDHSCRAYLRARDLDSTV